MLPSAKPDPRVQFVADQLMRTGWISGYRYMESEGYRLDWSAAGAHWMSLLQIALKASESTVHGLDRLSFENASTQQAITDFWDACMAQLALTGEKDAIPTFAKIIECWQPAHAMDAVPSSGI